ncbi:MAG: nitroreductase [Spirochaetales bacterium]|nr:nitroreductase [Spirochaetales bacterium]
MDARPIDEEVLTRLVEAAVTAPSANNSQPWRFITVTDPAVLAEVKGALTPGNYWAQSAPAITAVVTNDEWSLAIGDRVFAPFEVGMATMAYQAQAVSEGLYIHPIAGFNADAVKEALKIPASETLLTLLIIGYPGDDSTLREHHLASERGPRVRLPLDRVYAKDRWNDGLLPKKS